MYKIMYFNVNLDATSMPEDQQSPCYQHAILPDGTIWTDVIKRDILLIAYYLLVRPGYNIAYMAVMSNKYMYHCKQVWNMIDILWFHYKKELK